MKLSLENLGRFWRDLNFHRGHIKFWPRLVTTIFVWTYRLHFQGIRVNPKTNRIDAIVFCDSLQRMNKITTFIEEMVAKEEELAKVMR